MVQSKKVHPLIKIDETTLNDNLYKTLSKEVNDKFHHHFTKESNIIKNNFQNYYHIGNARTLLDVINTGCAKYDNVYVIQLSLTTKSDSENIIMSFIDSLNYHCQRYLNVKAERYIERLKQSGHYGKKKIDVGLWRTEVDYFFTKSCNNAKIQYKGIIVLNKDAFKVVMVKNMIDHHATLEEVAGMIKNSWTYANNKFNSDYCRSFIDDKYTCYGDDKEGYENGHTGNLRAICVKQVFGNIVNACCRNTVKSEGDGKLVFKSALRTNVDDYTFYEYCKLPLLYSRIPNNTEMFTHKTVPEEGYKKCKPSDINFDDVLNTDLLNNIERFKYIVSLPIKSEEIRRINSLNRCNDNIVAAEKKWVQSEYTMRYEKVNKQKFKRRRSKPNSRYDIV